MNILWSMFFICHMTLMVAATCPIGSPCSCQDDSNNPGKRVIYCERFSLTSVPTITPSNEVFSKLTLKHNNIAIMGSGAFTGLKVESIDLLENSLSQIDINAFSGLEGVLKTLYLQGNKTVSPPFTAMQNLSSITSLWLEFFNLPQIRATTPFEYFPALETLILMDMKTEFIETSSFANKLENIKKIQFTNNPGVSILPIGIFRHLRTLTHLEWLHNDMTKIPSGAFSELTNLVELDLRGNMIAELQSGCFNGINQTLEYLGLHLNSRLNENNAAELGRMTWPNLQQLNLGQNNFTVIPSGLFGKMPSLSYLGLQGNKLSQIGSTYFQGLSAMHSIDLAENEIHTIQAGAFFHMPQLQVLDLQGQKKLSSSKRLNLGLEQISGIQNSVQTLHLDETYLAEATIWDAIEAMKNLANLEMSNTGVTYIRDLVFRNHKSLTYLSLPNNGIVNITQASLHGLNSSLQSLNLQNNLISVIDECVFKTFTSLQFLYLGGNPLLCDCKIIWLYDWLQQIINDPNHPNKDIINSLVKPVCDKPDNLNGKHLINDLQRSNLTCPVGTPAVVCQDYTQTTTTTSASTSASTEAPISTTASTTTVPVPDIDLTLTAVGTNIISISWLVQGDASNIDKYEIEYTPLSGGGVTTKIPIDKSLRLYEIKNLEPGTNYEICLQAFVNLVPAGLLKCRQKPTNSGETTTQSLTISDSGNVGVIIGSVIGGILAIILIILVLFILLKYRATPKTKQPPAAAVTFTPTERPRVGYDSKRFSKQKNNAQNGDIQIRTVSDGKTDNPRISAGSYQYINENAAVSSDPYPSKLQGANGTTNDLKEPSKLAFSNNPHHAQPSSKSRYVNTPRAAAPNKPHYVNNIHGNQPHDEYANAVETRPLPKAPKTPLSDSSSGFLNHGFAPSPTDTEYHEINFDSGTVI